MDNERAMLASLVAPQHSALLVVDVQPVFTTLPLRPALDEVLPRLRRCLAAARAAGVPRVFIRHVIPEGRWTEAWRRQYAGRALPGGTTLKDALAPAPQRTPSRRGSSRSRATSSSRSATARSWART